jgi:hypothetical protein
VVDSGVVRQLGVDWLGVGSYVGIATGVAVEVLRWGGTSWAQVGSVRIGDFGQLGSSPQGGGLVPEALTGSGTPDFALNGSGADTHWFAVVSHVAGRWQGVPFDWVGKPTVAISGGNVEGSLVQGALDACGCASGPESYLWYEYSPSRREFMPVPPPGLPAPCTVAALRRGTAMSAIDLERVSCVDGWAVGAGVPRDRATLVLLEQQGTGWQAVNTETSKSLTTSLKALTADYLVPSDVLAKLAAGLGAAPRP